MNPALKPGAAAPARRGSPEGSNRDQLAWCTRRERCEGCDWLCLELTASDGVQGIAWAPYTAALQTLLEEGAGLNGGNGHDGGMPTAPNLAHQFLLAEGLFATARLDLESCRHDVPLHVWLGGAIRKHVEVTLPLWLRSSSALNRPAELERCRSLISEASRYGVTSYALYDEAGEIERIAEAVEAIRGAIGMHPRLAVRLAGQLSASDARSLASRLRSANLVCLADPCATVLLSAEATNGSLPALGLSAWRYDRASLLDALLNSPPAVMFVDPLLEGGPRGVRRLASIARVLQVDVSLTAETGGVWLTQLCAELAAISPASHQPVILPAMSTNRLLEQLSVSDGKLSLDARRSQGLPVSSTEQLSE